MQLNDIEKFLRAIGVNLAAEEWARDYSRVPAVLALPLMVLFDQVFGARRNCSRRPRWRLASVDASLWGAPTSNDAEISSAGPMSVRQRLRLITSVEWIGGEIERAVASAVLIKGRRHRPPTEALSLGVCAEESETQESIHIGAAELQTFREHAGIGSIHGECPTRQAKPGSEVSERLLLIRILQSIAEIQGRGHDELVHVTGDFGVPARVDESIGLLLSPRFCNRLNIVASVVRNGVPVVVFAGSVRLRP